MKYAVYYGQGMLMYVWNFKMKRFDRITMKFVETEDHESTKEEAQQVLDWHNQYSTYRGRVWMKEVKKDNSDVSYKDGGIPQRYKDMGFSKVGEKKKSTIPEKKWMVLAKKGDKYKVVHGGAKGMQDYSQHHDKERRKRFWDRMGGRNSDKARDPFSPLYWHKKFGTWSKGGVLENGTLKVVWIDTDQPETFESKMFDTIEDALKYADGKTYLIMQLEDHDDNYYKWTLLPYGEHERYKTVINWSNIFEDGGRIPEELIQEGAKVELEHKDTIEKIKRDKNISTEEAARLIAIDHLNESLDYYDKLKKVEKKSTGGLLVGKTDKDGHEGIEVLTPSGKVIMGGGEVVVNSDAVKSEEKHTFNGEKKTNCEILSDINQSTGGVKIPCDVAELANTTDSKLNPRDVINRKLYGGQIGAKQGNYKGQAFTNSNNEFRFEIDDSKAKIIANVDDILSGKVKSLPITHFIDHKELFKYYPKFKLIKVFFNDSKEFINRNKFISIENIPNIFASFDSNGAIDQSTYQIIYYINYEKFRTEQQRKELAWKSMHFLLEGGVGELQHAIQSAEGFEVDRGIEYYARVVQEGIDFERSQIIDLPKNDINKIAAEQRIKWLEENLFNEAYRLYIEQFAEKESRSAISRINMTIEERKKLPPSYFKGGKLSELDLTKLANEYIQYSNAKGKALKIIGTCELGDCGIESDEFLKWLSNKKVNINDFSVLSGNTGIGIDYHVVVLYKPTAKVIDITHKNMGTELIYDELEFKRRWFNDINEEKIKYTLGGFVGAINTEGVTVILDDQQRKRFKINDVNSIIDENLLMHAIFEVEKKSNVISFPLNSILTSWDGYKYYPDLKIILINIVYSTSSDYLAAYDINKDSITINVFKLLEDYGKYIRWSKSKFETLHSNTRAGEEILGGDERSKRSYLLRLARRKIFHEIQHAIQKREGIELNVTSKEEVIKYLKKFYNKEHLTEEQFKDFLVKKQGKSFDKAIYEEYKFIPSEREAFEVEQDFFKSESFSKGGLTKTTNMNKAGKLDYIFEGQEVKILRGKHKDKIGVIKNVEFTDEGKIKDDQIDIELPSGEMSYLGIDDIEIMAAKGFKVRDGRVEGGLNVRGLSDSGIPGKYYHTLFTGAETIDQAVELGKKMFKADDRVSLVEITSKKKDFLFATITQNQDKTFNVTIDKEGNLQTKRLNMENKMDKGGGIKDFDNASDHASYINGYLEQQLNEANEAYTEFLNQKDSNLYTQRATKLGANVAMAKENLDYEKRDFKKAWGISFEDFMSKAKFYAVVYGKYPGGQYEQLDELGPFNSDEQAYDEATKKYGKGVSIDVKRKFNKGGLTNTNKMENYQEEVQIEQPKSCLCKETLGAKHIDSETIITDLSTGIASKVERVTSEGVYLKPISSIIPTEEFFLSYDDLRTKFHLGEISISGYENVESDKQVLYLVTKAMSKEEGERAAKGKKVKRVFNGGSVDSIVEDAFFKWDDIFEDEREGIETYVKNGERVIYLNFKGKSQEDIDKFMSWLQRKQGVSFEMINPTRYIATIRESMSKGGGIPNNYQGKTPDKIWEEWSDSQRRHFLTDHKKEWFVSMTSSGNEYLSEVTRQATIDDFEYTLPEVQDALSRHVMMGQYDKGGKTKLCPIGMEIQTVIFKKDKFSKGEATEWLDYHNMKSSKVDEKANSWRFRQEKPSNFRKNSLRSKNIKEGITLVVGCPKKK